MDNLVCDTGNARFVAYTPYIPGCLPQCPVDVNIVSAPPVVVETETSGYRALYNGIPANIEIIRDEDGTFQKYVAHMIDGSGLVVDPANPALITAESTISNQIREVCEAIPATLNTNLTFTLVGQTLTINNSSTVTGDAIIRNFVDWADGTREFGTNVNRVYKALENGLYRVKYYTEMVSGARFVREIVLAFTAGVPALVTTSPVVVTNSYSVPNKIQAVYDKLGAFVRYQNVDGTVYTTTNPVTTGCVSVPEVTVLTSEEPVLYVAPVNSNDHPYRETIPASSTVTYPAGTIKSITYSVIGTGATMLPAFTGVTQNLLDTETATFTADTSDSLTDDITFTTSATSTIVVWIVAI